jgi:hypothetical protein
MRRNLNRFLLTGLLTLSFASQAFAVCRLVSLNNVGGDGQSAPPLQTLPNPLSVQVIDSFNTGLPFPGYGVNFQIISVPDSSVDPFGFAVLIDPSDGSQSGDLTVFSDANGIAAPLFQLGSATGTYTIRAGACSFDHPVFNENAASSLKLAVSVSPTATYPDILNPRVVLSTPVPANYTVISALATNSGQAQQGEKILLMVKSPVFGVDSEPSIGGHEHDDTRPIGEFVPEVNCQSLDSKPNPVGVTCTICTTNANGLCVLGNQNTPVYFASEYGGLEHITATSLTHPGVSANTDLTVKAVDIAGNDLYDLASTGASFVTFTGNSGSTSYNCDASHKTIHHPSNHWATRTTALRVLSGAITFYNQTASESSNGAGTKLGVNDMSLQYGGMFDICGQWHPGHQCHRAGDGVDVDKSALDSDDKQTLIQIMGKVQGHVVPEGLSLHFQFPGRENCYDVGGL